MNDKIKLTCTCGKEFETYKLKLIDVERPLSLLCPTCREQKLKEQEALEREQLEKESRERKQSWLLSCGIPRRFQDRSFDNFITKTGNTKKIKDICLDYANNFPLLKGIGYHSLGIFSKGIWGNGKSHLACSIAKKIIERWLSPAVSTPVIYITEPEMFRKIRATYNNSGETEQSLYNLFTNVPLLIIDDVGKEEVSDPRFVQRIWFSVINGRYDNLLPIVVTANLTPDEIAHHLGGSRGNEAAFDRLYEMVQGRFWDNTGEGFRRNEELSSR